MDLPLQLPLYNESDILHAHHIALEIAREAGLSPRKQLNFAWRLTQLCSQTDLRHDMVAFSQHQTGKRILLRAITKKAQGSLEIEIPKQIQTISEKNLPDPGGNTDRQDDYKNLQHFSMALSHELKNCIANIKMAVHLLENEEMNTTVADYFQIIERASGKLDKTMIGLNDLLRVTQCPGAIHPVSLASIVESVQQDFADTIHSTGATINTNFTEMETIQYVDSFLRMVFLNLVSNALKYIHPERPLQLLITAKRHQEYVVLSFMDNGTGMDMNAVKTKLFEPFARFNKQVEGTGLGLYLIKSIVEKNGGRIEVTSEPGNGSTFHLYLIEY